MRPTKRLITLAATAALAAPTMLTAGAGVAGGDGPVGANAGGGTFVAFSQIARRCDFSELNFKGPTGNARVTADVRTDGSSVTADVQMLVGIPNMHYDVRLIQLPRPSSVPCPGGAPGVVYGALNTDGAGAARVTLSDNVEPGSTGVWVWVTRPDAFSQDPAEFYTSDFVVPV
jgi:hypothetical protein